MYIFNKYSNIMSQIAALCYRRSYSLITVATYSCNPNCTVFVILRDTTLIREKLKLDINFSLYHLFKKNFKLFKKNFQFI